MKMLQIITLVTIALSGPRLLADAEAAEMAGARAEHETFAEQPGAPEQQQVRMTGEGHQFVSQGETGNKLSRFRESGAARGRADAVSGTGSTKKPVVGPPGPPTPPRDEAAILRALGSPTAREERPSTIEQRSARRKMIETAITDHEARMQEHRRINNPNERIK